ncbi:ABC transporter permease [Kibdelosporangium phytohabitans]|nr:FtsX-like permease family protein [Kibdelosporangium phytohabitans]MBE1463599.1 putative ABC transport system permease protein [Kibdelosporangium phytohabitans]
MVKLALASLRRRAAAALATFIAVSLGASILIACGGLFETAIRLEAPPQRLAGVPVVLTGPSGFALPDEETETVAYPERARVAAGLVDRIAAIPGVERAVADVSIPVTIADTALSGHSWQSAALTPYTLSDGSEPRMPGQVVLTTSSGARPGDKVDIVVAGAPKSFTVSGVAAGPAQAVFFSDGDVQRYWPRPGFADLIGVFTTDVDTLARQLPPDLSILVGDDRGAAEFTAIGASFLPLILLSSIFSGMMLVFMALVIAATIGLSVRQRQQELALLRATGATPRQVHRMVVAETMIVSLVAVVAGMALGAFTGGWIFSVSASQGVVPEALTFHQGIIPFAAGTLAVLVISWLAAHFSARTAARARPIQALAEAAVPDVRLSPIRLLSAKVCGLATLVLVLTTVFFDPETASSVGGPALLTGVVTIALLAPALIVKAVGLARKNTFATINVRVRAVQFAAVLTPVTLAVTIALGNIYGQTTKAEAATSAYLSQFEADAVVTPSAGGISPELAGTVRTAPGVTSVTSVVSSRGWIEEPYDSKGSDPSTLTGVDGEAFTVPVTAGSMADLAGNTVALPENQAEDLGLTLGSHAKMRLGDGAQVDVRVVALLDSPSYYGSLILPASLLAQHTTAGLPSQLLVRGTGHVAEAVRTHLSGVPGITVDDSLTTSVRARTDVEGWINYLLAGLAITYAAIATVNTIVVSVLSRRREFAVQRLAGATRRQVTRMLMTESAIVATTGLALGTVTAALSVESMALAGGSIIPSGPLWIFLAVVLATFLIVWPATAVAARHAMKPKPIEAIG